MTNLLAGRYAVQIPAEENDPLVEDMFKSAFRNHPLGVAVVTGDPGGSPVAMTVSSLSSVSVSPPLLSFSASVTSSSTTVLDECDSVVVHMLGAEHVELAKLGATSGIDRFADTSTWYRLASGEPLFHGVQAWMRADIVHRVDVGGSVVYLARVVEATVPHVPSAAPLVYHDRTWHQLGARSSLT